MSRIPPGGVNPDCVKCGGYATESSCRYDEGTLVSRFDGLRSMQDDKIWRQCRRCGYEWSYPCLDAGDVGGDGTKSQGGAS